jgi:hypothetical protein
MKTTGEFHSTPAGGRLKLAIDSGLGLSHIRDARETFSLRYLEVTLALVGVMNSYSHPSSHLHKLLDIITLFLLVELAYDTMSIDIQYYNTDFTTHDPPPQRTWINADPTSSQTTDETSATESDILSALQSIPPPTTAKPHAGLSTSDKVAIGSWVAVACSRHWCFNGLSPLAT